MGSRWQYPAIGGTGSKVGSASNVCHNWWQSRTVQAFIWTIRLPDVPAKIIGDAALHHYDQQQKTIEIGGSLLPAYWGKNLMKQAFELLIDFAGQTLNVEQIIGRNSPNNAQAIRLVEKLGFQRVGVIENEMVLRKNYR